MKFIEDVCIKRVYSTFTTNYYDKRKFENDIENGIWSEINGKEYFGKKSRTKKIFNENIVCYLDSHSNIMERHQTYTRMTRNNLYAANGFYVRSDNYLEKLPMFSAGFYPSENKKWYISSIIYRSGDGKDKYERDLKNGKLDKFLIKNLLYVCLSTNNKVRSLIGSDKRKYRNELCLDDNLGETLAIKDLKKIELNDDEKKIIALYHSILKQAKETNEYNKELNYSLFQIKDELNTYYKDEKNKTIYNYPNLNGDIKVLKKLLKDYSLEEIAPKLFEYEFLK